MQAIILTGGLGTRLRSVVQHLPKTMAPIQEKPFLAYLLHYLKTQGVTQVCLSVHYLHEHITQYFEQHACGINIQYIVEDVPLGTGGAFLNAFQQLAPKKSFFLLNGDSFLKINYASLFKTHQTAHAYLTMAVCHQPNCYRYGAVQIKNHHIVGFKEKGESGPGLISAGLAVIHPRLLDQIPPLPSPPFSFEQDVLLPYAHIIQPRAFIADDYFIDIGIPEDYERAQKELTTHLSI